MLRAGLIRVQSLFGQQAGFASRAYKQSTIRALEEQYGQGIFGSFGPDYRRGREIDPDTRGGTPIMTWYPTEPRRLPGQVQHHVSLGLGDRTGFHITTCEKTPQELHWRFSREGHLLRVEGRGRRIVSAASMPVELAVITQTASRMSQWLTQLAAARRSSSERSVWRRG